MKRYQVASIHSFTGYILSSTLAIGFGWMQFEITAGAEVVQLSDQPTSSPPDEPTQTIQLNRARALNLQALQLYQYGKFQQALPLAREALRLREQFLSSHHLDVADSLQTLGVIQTSLVIFQEAWMSLEGALQIREQSLGLTHQAVAEVLTNLGRLHMEMSDFSRAEQVLLRALRIRQEQLDDSHPDVGVTLTYLSHVRFLKGDLPAAKAGYEEAYRIFESSPNTRPGEYGWTLNGLAYVQQRMGNMADARNLVERALRVRETAFGPHHPQVAATLTHLVELMQYAGDFESALPLAERVVRMDEEVFGGHHPRVASSLQNLSRIKSQLGHQEEAKHLRERALQIQLATLGPKHYLVADALIALAWSLNLPAELERAVELIQQALVIQEDAFGHDGLYVSISLNSLGWLLLSKGDYHQARPLLERALQIRLQLLPPGHPDLETSFNNLARLLDMQGDLDGARAYYEQARRLLTIGAHADLDDPVLSQQWSESVERLKDYVKLLVKIVNTKSDASAVSDAFLIADQARGWVVQAAVAQAMARQGRTNTDQGEVSRRIDALRHEQKVLWNRLGLLYGQAVGSSSMEEVPGLKVSAQRVQQELDAALAELSAIAPRFTEVAVPKPIDAATVQQLLHHDEALLSYYTMNDHLLIWLLRPGQPLVFQDISVPRTKLDTLLKRVRGSISSHNLPFDVESSFDLFNYLIAPILPMLQEVRHLIVVPDQTLLQLPFSVLLMDNTQSAYRHAAQMYHESRPLSVEATTHYARLPWLLNKYAITVLPSAATLRLLRQNSGIAREGKEPFIGFGNPDFTGKTGMREISNSLQELEPLPGTRDELEAVAKALEATADDQVYLGQRATEFELRKLDRSGRLGEARVLFFATHGLLAGDLHGLVNQPSLALSPGDNDDGVLTRDEILLLRLPHTSWVVLSACDTGDDRSQEGLSGLVRAFLYAGARSLMVSHWKVKDHATRELMTQVFQRYAKDKTLGPAESLRQGMLALLSQARDGINPRYAHPYAWASFFLVGEGA